MEKKPKKIKIILPIILLLVVISIIVDGVAIGIYGVFQFSSKYYDTPTLAFEAEEDSPEFAISGEIGTVKIDDTNCMLLALTENGDVMVAQMIAKDNKYYYIGNVILCSAENADSSEEPLFYSGCLYKSNGRFKNNFEYAVSFDENFQTDTNTDKVSDFSGVGSYEDLYFIYRETD